MQKQNIFVWDCSDHLTYDAGFEIPSIVNIEVTYFAITFLPVWHSYQYELRRISSCFLLAIADIHHFILSPHPILTLENTEQSLNLFSHCSITHALL